MTYFYAILMGVVQGLTEFLPISSSGHLVILQNLLGVEGAGLGFNLILHLGTLIAVIIYYNKDIWAMTRELVNLCSDLIRNKGKIDFRSNEHRFMLVLIVVAVIPTAVIGFLFNDFFEILFQNWHIVGYTLIVTGILLWSLQFLPIGKKNIQTATVKDALFIGIIQGAAITPGISRSGSTIFAGMLTGLTKESATRFSFLLSIPAILAAIVLESSEIVLEMSKIGDWFPVLAGFFASMISGYFAIDLLISLLKKQKLVYFSYYCWVIGSLTILYQWFF